jgi:acetate---CoA ligase (ADP-forming) subunit beta
MLSEQMAAILSGSKQREWVLEPEAIRFLSLAGLEIPQFVWARNEEEALQFADRVGYPVVAKVISPDVIHKTEVKGVAVGIDRRERLIEAFQRLRRMKGAEGVLVEETLSGIELIIGAKVDEQFGPVVLLGMGGTGVEIYRDVSLRMAPLRSQDAESMMKCLKAYKVLEGYRGSAPVNGAELTRTLMTFSQLVMDLEEWIESVDLNPVFCSPERCVVADARIMLKKISDCGSRIAD